jgi:hypothetical protein
MSFEKYTKQRFVVLTAISASYYKGARFRILTGLFAASPVVQFHTTGNWPTIVRSAQQWLVGTLNCTNVDISRDGVWFTGSIPATLSFVKYLGDM